MAREISSSAPSVVQDSHSRTVSNAHNMSTTTSLPQLYVRLITLTRSIPRDPLRPSLQLSDTLEHAVNRALGVDGLAQSSRPEGRGDGITNSPGNASATAVLD